MTPGSIGVDGGGGKSASIGVDVGGTKIAAALVAGDVLARTTVRTNASRPGGEVLSDAVAAAQAMAEAAA